MPNSSTCTPTLRAAKKPMVILGRGALARPDGAAVLAAAWAIARSADALREDWHGFNLLHLFGGQVAPLAMGFLPGAWGKDLGAMLSGGVDALWLLGADGIDAAAKVYSFACSSRHRTSR